MGIKEVYELLNKYRGFKFEVTHHIGENEPISSYEGTPTKLFCEYVDEEYGHALAVHFDNFTIECAENEFSFETGTSTINGQPYGPYAIISFKDHKRVYIMIEFK